MDAVGIAIIICVVVGLVIAAVVGVIAFMAGSSHRKKSAEATIGSAEEEAKKKKFISYVMNPKKNLQNDAKKYSVRNDAFNKEKNLSIKKWRV